ncbi:MAG: PQQ-binding-like beta-propeller repeat protein [Candidatus Dormibacteraeota bacterium]|nr:PQQ-binding-like beta-propeller repeat protein [Candidatus Dormibacteraeota bacterium]
MPLSGKGSVGFDVANPVISNGIAYLQDGASDVSAVQSTTGKVLWTHMYSSTAYGPNGVTFANGKVYGITANGVFALDATTGQQAWYVTDFGPPQARFNMPPQVAGCKVFVSSSITVGGGIIYALDATTGATDWSFQTVIDQTGQQLQATAGGAWDATLIGPDQSVYAGIGNPYLSLQKAEQSPSRELYTDSVVKLNRVTGKLEWYYQAFPDDFHDWDLQISPIYTTAGSRPVVLASGKGGFVFAFDPGSGQLLWKTSVGVHNGHDNDDQLALERKLQLKAPYVLIPGEIGGVETNMAAADGVAYVPVDNVPTTYATSASVVGTPDLTAASGEMVALDIASGKQLWITALPNMALGGASVSNDIVFTSTFNGEIFALSRKDGSILWTSQLPAGSNSTLAIAGDTLIAGAGLPLKTSQHPKVVAYQLP